MQKLLHLPAEILIYIYTFLPAPSAHSLSLTCKAAYRLGPSAKLPPALKAELLQILERDPSCKGLYFCNSCYILHQFDPGWTVSPHNSKKSIDRPCKDRNCFSPVGNPYNLTYTQSRLVINRFLYGNEYGISLRNICIQHTIQRDVISVHCSTAANILRGELFLQRRYTFQIHDDDVARWRECTGPRDFCICSHVACLNDNSMTKQFIPEFLAGFEECVDELGSCGICLTDYGVSIRRCRGGWEVCIRAYHNVGSCRSQNDWKWARFTECSPLWFGSSERIRGEDYPDGAVKKAWDEGVHGKGLVNGWVDLDVVSDVSLRQAQTLEVS